MVALASGPYSSVSTGSVMGAAPEPRVPMAAPCATTASPHEATPFLPAPGTRAPYSQAAGDLPAGADPSLVDYEALCARLGSIDPALLTESERQVMAILGLLRGGESAPTRRTSFLQDVGGAAAELTPTALPTPSEEGSGADAMAQLLLMFLSLQAELGRTATTLRSNAIKEKLIQMQEAADKIREAAKATKAAAIVQGAMGIAGGVTQVGMGVYSGYKTNQARQDHAKADGLTPPKPNVSAAQDMRVAASSNSNVQGAASQAKPATPATNGSQALTKGGSVSRAQSERRASGGDADAEATPADLAKAQKFRQQAEGHQVEAQRANTMAQSIGPLSNGLGTISTAWLQQDAQMLQAGQKEDDAAAAMAEQSISDATSMYGQSLQASAAALQTIQAVLQARVQADRSVYRVGA